MVDIQSATAEIKREKKKKETQKNETGQKYNVHICYAGWLQIVLLNQLECGQMPNVMVALPNIGGVLCSTPQTLADGHY